MKPTVEFTEVIVPPVVGGRARVYAKYHPVLGHVTDHLHTSEVLKVEEDGSFETLNTYYKKV